MNKENRSVDKFDYIDIWNSQHTVPGSIMSSNRM
jgi:hypothetical protein